MNALAPWSSRLALFSLSAVAVLACDASPTRAAADASTRGGGADSGGTTPPAADAGGSLFDAALPPGSSTDAGGADAAAPPLDAAASGPLLAYASGYGPNINVYTVNPTTGALTPRSSTPAFGPSPSYLAIDHATTYLYAVDEEDPGKVGAYSIDPKSGALTFLNSQSSGGQGPPYVGLDVTERYVLVANYDDGGIAVFPVQANGSLGAPTSALNAGKNAHMILTDPSNKFAFVPCLGSDYIAQYQFDATSGKLTPNAVPTVATAKGAGPRHVAFHPNGKVLYGLNETNSTVTTYAFDASLGTLSIVQTLSALPAGFTKTNTGAEIHVHPSGAWVLVSNRGEDSVDVFAVDPAKWTLTRKGATASGGASPRDFTFDPSATLVYTANQDTGNVVPFKFDPGSGTLTATAAAVTLTQASFVGVVRLPGGTP